jgi:hypothetical protein
MIKDNQITNLHHLKLLEMTPIGQGAWEAKVTGDYMFKYYTFSVNNSGITV